MVVEQIERYLMGDTYWSYGSSGEVNDAAYFPLLARPYPSAIAGTLISYQSNMENGTLNCVWK